MRIPRLLSLLLLTASSLGCSGGSAVIPETLARMGAAQGDGVAARAGGFVLKIELQADSAHLVLRYGDVVVQDEVFLLDEPVVDP